MGDSKISSLTNYTSPIATDVLPIVDITQGTTKKITAANLQAFINNTTGNFTGKHLVGNSSTPALNPGTGAGTTPTVAIVGNDMAGKISITAGTSPQANDIAAIVFSTAFAVAPYVTLTPGNAAAAALSGTTGIYISTAATTNFNFRCASSNLAGATAYIWYYNVIA